VNKQERQQYRKARIKELQTTIVESYKELDTWRIEEYKEQNVSIVGKCFRYENKWQEGNSWFYFQAIGVDEEGRVEIWSFEKRPKDEIRICFRNSYRTMSNEYEEIPSEQFWTEWEKLRSELDALANINQTLTR